MGLDSIINTIYQTFDGIDVYPSVEEKTTNFLYLIDSKLLVALTLLIAESNPKEKDILISLTMNFLV